MNEKVSSDLGSGFVVAHCWIYNNSSLSVADL